jgi:nucleotide-binding universal stress UspA family protein
MKQFKNILYVADPSSDAVDSFHSVVDLAERANASLTLIATVEEIPFYVKQPSTHSFQQVLLESKRDELAKLAASVSERVNVEIKVVEGTLSLEIVRDVLRFGRDLVVKTAEREQGVMGKLVGTTDMHILRKCPCPVWLVHPTSPAMGGRLLAAVDITEKEQEDQDSFDPLNRKIIEFASSIAALENKELHVVHAWHPIGLGAMRRQKTGLSDKEAAAYEDDFRLMHQNWLDRLMSKAEEWIGEETYGKLQTTAHLIKGRARDTIPILVDALDVDLIVMGTVARTGVSGLLMGNTAENILYQLDCSVLAVKPDGFISPVTLEE